MSPSLHDIEKTLTALWIDRVKRDEFLAGDSSWLDPKIDKEIDRSGLELYADLLNYGHHGVMSSIYPLCEKLLGKVWQGAVELYLEECPPNHYNLNRMAKRFPEFVMEHLPEQIERFPFLGELADYEWVEMELLEYNEDTPRSDLASLQSPTEFAEYAPIVNPASIIRHYQFPIIEIASKIENSKRKLAKVRAKKSYVVTYRDPKTNRCRFMDVGETAAALIESAKAQATPYTQLITQAVALNPDSDPQTTITQFIELVDNLQSSNVFLGNRNLSQD